MLRAFISTLLGAMLKKLESTKAARLCASRCSEVLFMTTAREPSHFHLFPFFSVDNDDNMSREIENLDNDYSKYLLYSSTSPPFQRELSKPSNALIRHTRRSRDRTINLTVQ